MPPTSGEPGRSNVALGRKMPIFMMRRCRGPRGLDHGAGLVQHFLEWDRLDRVVVVFGLNRAVQLGIRLVRSARLQRRAAIRRREKRERRAANREGEVIRPGGRRRRKASARDCARASSGRESFPASTCALLRDLSVAAMVRGEGMLAAVAGDGDGAAEPLGEGIGQPRPVLHRPALDLARRAGMNHHQILARLRGIDQMRQRHLVRRWLDAERGSHGEIVLDGVPGGVTLRLGPAQLRRVGHPARIARPARAIAQEAAHAATPEVRHEVRLGHVGEQRDRVRVLLQLLLERAPAEFAAHGEDVMQARVLLVKLGVGAPHQHGNVLAAEALGRASAPAAA